MLFATSTPRIWCFGRRAHSRGHRAILTDTFLQLNEQERVTPVKMLGERIRSRGTELAEFAIELEEPTAKVSEFFPQQSPEDVLSSRLLVSLLCCRQRYSDVNSPNAWSP
jgi:hypothetical protein